MNKRLLSISELIHDGKGVADVGTDHAFLPVYLAQNGYHGNIIASDINSGPIESAKKTVREAGLEERIDLFMGDGLSLYDPDSIDTIVIAGMGGELICTILDNARWTMSPCYTLILQPMTKAEVLRYWLINNGYNIICERIVEDEGKLYQIIVSRFDTVTDEYSEAELFIGKYEKVCREKLFPLRLKSLTDSFEKAASGMRLSENASSRFRLTEKISGQLTAMKGSDDI